MSRPYTIYGTGQWAASDASTALAICARIAVLRCLSVFTPAFAHAVASASVTLELGSGGGVGPGGGVGG